MRKPIWILALIALVFIGDRVGGYLLKNITEKSQFRYSRLYRGAAQCDLLFVGNSRGLMFYQPYIEKLTGASTLNISYNGLPVDLANVLVKDQLDKHQPPKKMIVEITLADRFNNQLISGFSPYASFSNRLDSLLFTKTPKSFYGGKISHLYLYNTEIFQRALYYLDKKDEDWLLDRVINEKVIADIVNEPEYSITMEDYLLENLAELVNYAKSMGTEVYLVVNPYYPPFGEKIVNLDEIIQKVESKTNLEVHNFAFAINEVEGFGDYQHLNKNGSKIYIDTLIKNGILNLAIKDMGNSN